MKNDEVVRLFDLYAGDLFRFALSYMGSKRAAIEEDKEGMRFEGYYRDDMRDGKFVEKDRNGKVIASGTYTRGHRQVD